MQRVTVLPVGAFRLSPKQHYGTVCLCILFIRERQHDGTSSYGHLRYKTGTSDFSKNWSALPGVLAQAGAGTTERRCHRAAGWLRIMGSARNRRRKLDGVCSWCGRGSSKHSASTTTRQDIHCEELVDVVRKRGFEPPLPCGNKLLRLARLPVPPLPHEEGEIVELETPDYRQNRRWPSSPGRPSAQNLRAGL